MQGIRQRRPAFASLNFESIAQSDFLRAYIAWPLGRLTPTLLDGASLCTRELTAADVRVKMKLLLHRHRHHERYGKKDHHKEKKSHKILKKMAKLEKKLSKYNFDNTSSDNDSCSSSGSTSRSRSHSRSRKKCMNRRHRKPGRRFGSHGRSSSSDSSSSASSSSTSSRSPSPPAHHHRRHHGPPRHFSRSRSFAGRGSCSPPPFTWGHHHRSHHRGRFCRHRHLHRQGDGIQGCLFGILAQSEPNLQGISSDVQNRERQEQMDVGSASRSVSREPEVPATASVEMDQDVQEVDGNATNNADCSPKGPELDATLAENWMEIIQNGLPADAKESLLKKYPVSKNCLLLRGPKINKEIVPVATEAAIKRDNIQMHAQNQIGTGLTALGQAISDLNNKSELKKDKEIAGVLETLNEAAVIILDVQHNMTKTRQAFMLPEVNKRVRSIVESCKPDEFLYGNNFGEKVTNVKGFGKYRRGWKGDNPECQFGKGGKRKHADHDGEKRKSKRLDSLGPFRKGFMNCHHGPKKH